MASSNPHQPPASIKQTGTDAAGNAPAFSVSPEPVVAEGTFGDAHKYEAAPLQDFASAPPPASDYEDLGTLPTTYDEDTLFLAARDPRWLFSYWDFDWSRYPGPAHRYGVAQFFLKLTTFSGEQETMVEIKPEARNWYVPVNQPDTTYVGEIGYFDRNATWIRIVSSGPAHTPPDGLAPDGATEFATVPAHLAFQRLREVVTAHMKEGESLLQAIARITGEGREIAFAPGTVPTWTHEQRALLALLLGDNVIDRVGLGSAEIDQLLRKELSEIPHGEFSVLAFDAIGPDTSSLFSAIGASWSAQPFSLRAERGFYMHVNAEIIFYGGTHPDATVWVAGQQIKLSPDGTFRYQFTLPNGDFTVPIVAQSPDKVEQRSATFSFGRGTETVGKVGSTVQPFDLSPLIGRR